MKNAALIVQMATAILLIVTILVQSKGTGFGRSSRSGSSFTRRGLEKIVFRLTFVLAAIFIIISIFQLKM